MNVLAAMSLEEYRDSFICMVGLPDSLNAHLDTDEWAVLGRPFEEWSVSEIYVIVDAVDTWAGLLTAIDGNETFVLSEWSKQEAWASFANTLMTKWFLREGPKEFWKNKC